jgi:hypothetical protein
MKTKKMTKKQLWVKAWKLMRQILLKKHFDWRGYGKCFTCDKVLTLEDSGDAHCGHFRHGKNKEFYFDHKRNVRIQCRQCNFYGGEKIMSEYTIRLIEEIGIENVKELQASKDIYWGNKGLETVIKTLEDDLNSINKLN